MGGSKTQISFVLWIVLIGFTACVLAQGRGRRVRVRKTGEFGRRISPISTSYQPPPRERSGSDPYFETSETRRSGNVLGIPKPSQSLQLPIFTPPDQEAEESGENVQGYAYPDPSSGSPSSPTDDFSNNNQKPPILEFPQEVDEPQQQLDAAPVPVSPERVAELPPRGNRPVPLQAEAEESIGAEGLGGPGEAAPVRDTPSAETNCGENDDSCWPGGYKSEIPGDAGTDYPILSEIVDTSFDCDSVQYSGYYADTDETSRCQMFHVCLKGNAYRRTQKWSFLCPNGTVFSQNDFVCVWWNAAPECSSSIVSELSLRNEELGWDNLTEADQQGTAGFDVKSAMSSLANTNLQSSSTNSRLKNSLPEEARRPGRVRQGNGGNGNPYRVPVKVNTDSGARTKLKEVSHNSLQGEGGDLYGGVEHFGEESETFETSLRHQSEARRKTKSGSALAKSESEAYEQKSVSDPNSVSPFIVTRGGGSSDESDYSSSVEGRDEHEGTSVVMMDSQQRNPDGSEGIAQVPVRMEGEGGYRYPNPTGTPAPAYLPPRTTSAAANEIPTSTFLPEDNSNSDDQGYVYQTPEYSQQLLQDPGTTEEAGYRYPTPTTEEAGYQYPTPTTTEKIGYNYDAPSSTTEQSAEYNLEEAPSTTERGGGYNNNNNNNNNGKYEVPSTTEQQEEEGYKYPQPSTTETSSAVTEEEYSTNSLKPVFEEERNGGYAYEQSTSPRVPTTTFASTTTTATNQEEAELGSLEATTVGTNGGYLPPAKDGYSASQVHSVDPEVLALPNGGSGEENKDALGLEEVSSGELSTNAPGDGGGYGGGGSREETTTGLNIPTPSSTLPGGTHLDSADPPGRQDKVNEILEQIKLGGAEVRDENGNKIDFAQLQKLILSTPNGQLALQKADESTATTVASSSGVSETTEASVTSPATSGDSEGEENTEETPPGGYEEPATSVAASPTLETVQPIQDFVVNSRGPPVQSYSSGQPQESYFTNNRLVSSRHENFDISAPVKEYENHSVEQNSIDANAASLASSSGGVRNSFGGSAPGLSGYSTSPYESQRLSNQGQPQGLISQNFIGAPFQRQQEQVGFSSVRPSVPQPQQYYQQGGLSRGSEASYFSQSTVPTQQSSSYNFQPQQGQRQQQQQQPHSYFEPASNEYLPPVSSTSQSGAYRESSTQDKFRSAVALGSNVQLQQSYNVPIPQASSINRKLVNPGDIKIVPALFVHQHTRVENPDGSPVASNSNLGKTSSGRTSYPQSEGRFNGQFNIQSSRSAYIPYASQNVPVRVRAPRLAGFTRRDVFPLPKKVESFTAEDGRTKEQVEGETRKYQRKGEDSLTLREGRRRRRGSRSGPQGQLEVASNGQAPSENVYPGKVRS